MKKMILSLVLAFSLAFAFGAAAPDAAFASSTDAAKSAVCEGVNGRSGGTCGAGDVDLNNILAVVLNLISVVGGIIAVIMIIVAGIKYITSGGDAQAVAGAKRSLIYALVGLVIVALSQAIVRFVLTKLN